MLKKGRSLKSPANLRKSPEGDWTKVMLEQDRHSNDRPFHHSGFAMACKGS